MKKLEADVKEANKAYNAAEEEEDALIAKLARFRAIQAGAIPSTSKDRSLMAMDEDDLQKDVDAAAKKRRKLRTQGGFQTMV